MTCEKAREREERAQERQRYWLRETLLIARPGKVSVVTATEAQAREEVLRQEADAHVELLKAHRAWCAAKKLHTHTR